LSKFIVGYSADVVFECSASVEVVRYGLNFIKERR